ncbi:MAG TPA: metallophosphoesterase [Vicinamibacterales bacterium]|jgi:Icc-related predicted phosphoesterase|nr:metallophosphoesterase [Vicinamibacterales bacterium]
MSGLPFAVQQKRMPTKDVVRIAALGDLHFGKSAVPGSLQPLFSQISESADILVLTGDLTDYGLADEARALIKELAGIRIPIVGVLGNHDFESNQQDEIARLFKDAGVAMLDGDTTEILGVGFAGVKGFAGGFGRRALGPWGEQIIKQFVREAVDEALKLESALARLRNDRIVVILHYAPIQATVEGEPLDIYPFLGCSRLEDPITRFPVAAVFHGHAHHGCAEGRTRTNVPVFNVSMALMRETFPERPFRLVEVGAAAANERRSGADRRLEVHQ